MWRAYHTFVALAPSMRVLFAAVLFPLVCHESAREGLEGTECGVDGGAMPGIVMKRDW